MFYILMSIRICISVFALIYWDILFEAYEDTWLCTHRYVIRKGNFFSVVFSGNCDTTDSIPKIGGC